MEIDLNKECTEINIFINFSIRDYVAEMCKKNPVKCRPFGSLCDRDNKVVSSHQSLESTCLSGQSCPSNLNGSDDTTELTEAPNSSKVENLNGREDRPETTTGVGGNMGKDVCNGSAELTFCKVNNCQTQHEFNSMDEAAKLRHNEAADNNVLGRNRPRRKPLKFRLLSEIYKDPASELRSGCDRTNPENVNRRFVAEVEDDSDDDDDVTLAAYFRKQKGVELTGLTLNKKRNVIGIEEPSVDQDKRSNHGSKDSIRKDLSIGSSRKKSRTDDMDTQTMLLHKKLQCSQKSNQFAEVSSKEATTTEKENEDSEMEAVMLLARHFNEQKQILRELNSNPTCACAKKKIHDHSTQSGIKPATKTSSKTATKHPVKKINKNKVAKTTTDGGLQTHVEMSMIKATLACSFNRNPADFSIPNDENKFMRGC